MTKITIALSVSVFLLLIAITGIVYLWKDNRNLNNIIYSKTEELQSAKLEIGRAQTIIGDAQKEINHLSNTIKQELEKNKQLLKLYAELQGQYETEKNKVKIVTQIVYKDTTIPIPVGKIFVKLDDNTYQEVLSMKFNYNDFRLTINGDAIKQELDYKLHQNFRAVFVESTGPGGVINHYAEIYEQDDKGNDIGAIKLNKFIVVKSDMLKSKFMWWNPKLDIEVGSGLTLSNMELVPYFGSNISLMSYGKTEDDISWRFLKFGILCSNEKLLLNFSPVVGNIAKKLPLVSNIWLGPSISSNFNDLTMVGLGLSAVF